jgi:hypothetical protein
MLKRFANPYEADGLVKLPSRTLKRSEFLNSNVFDITNFCSTSFVNQALLYRLCERRNLCWLSVRHLVSLGVGNADLDLLDPFRQSGLSRRKAVCRVRIKYGVDRVSAL